MTFIVIVTHNGMQWLPKCLESVKAYSIIVVDNNSKDDDTREFIKKEYPEVEIFEKEENLGFGAANNLGIKKAYEEGAEYVFLLNQDAWIESNTIEKLIVVAQKHKNFGILSPMHLNGPGTALDYNFSTFIGADRCKGLISDFTVRNPLEEVYSTTFVNAAAWLLSRKCIETVGGFNPSFYHYAEDLNYVERAKYHKLEIGIVPSVKIYHDRQKRRDNLFLSNQKINFKRIVIRELSKPRKEKSITYFYLITIKKIILSLLAFNFHHIRNSFDNLSILFNIKYKKISRNRRLSLKRGLTYLR